MMEIEGMFEQVARCVSLVRDLLSREAPHEGGDRVSGAGGIEVTTWMLRCQNAVPAAA